MDVQCGARREGRARNLLGDIVSWSDGSAGGGSVSETIGAEDREVTASGPLADAEPATERPLEDPTLADHANPRWGDEPLDHRRSQSLVNPDGTSNVLPSSEPPTPPTQDDLARGTPQDQAARAAEPDVGRDNIREGRGGGTTNPALAEGGDNG
jgi:hypothetical protein